MQYRKDQNMSPVCFNLFNSCHDTHFIVYAAMFMGNYEIARKYSLKMLERTTLEVLKDDKCFYPVAAHWLEPYI